MTVSGWKRINAARQFGHHPFKTTQNNLLYMANSQLQCPENLIGLCLP